MDNPLAERIRAALGSISDVEEKKMFGGIAFMVNGKMCVTAGKNRIMCRIDPAIHQEALKKKGVKTVTMNGREYKGFVHVSEEAVRSKKDLYYWIDLALKHNVTLWAAKSKSARRKR